MDYFHLDYRPVDYFVGRLQTRLLQSKSASLRERFRRWDADTQGEPALAIVTKIEMLKRTVERLNADIAQMNEYLQGMPAAVEQCIRERRALNLPNRDVVWNMLVDIDGFLFEARSAYELLGKFLRAFFALIFQRKISEAEIIAAVRELGGDVAWVPTLRESRKLFFHNTAAWLAVERISADPPHFDLLLLKRNADTLAEDDFIHFRDCRAIQQGLADSIRKVALWINNEIAAVEREEDLLP